MSEAIYLNQKETAKFIDDYYRSGSKNHRFDQLIKECKQSVIRSIITPFGLGRFMAIYDQVGANVDTIHNARKGIYATQAEKEKYKKNEKYNSDIYHKDPNFININKELSRQKKAGLAVDYLTGEKIIQNEKTDLDHIVSAYEIHNDAGRILAEVEGTKLANNKENLKLTQSSLNRSKRALSMEEFLKRRDERLEAIEKLEQKRSLNSNELNELEKLKKQLKIDDEKALEADKKAREHINSIIEKEYYTSAKFAQNVAQSSAIEGAKMGIQQAFGLILVDFFSVLLDEIVDIYKNGFYNNFEGEGFFYTLKERIKLVASKVAERIKDKWSIIVSSFGDGFLSGVISNLTTTAINIFVTTSSRMVRVIREGIFSFFKAIKILLFPPDGMSLKDAWHEAKKLFIAGCITGLGIFIEQSLEAFLVSLGLGVFSSVITSVFVGVLTGIAIAVAMYYMDMSRKSLSQIRYEEIKALCMEKMPILQAKRKELTITIAQIHQERLFAIDTFLENFHQARAKNDSETIYVSLNSLSKLYQKEIKCKNKEDVIDKLCQGKGLLEW
ncbi:lactate permease [Campylobacter lari]